MGRVDYHDEVHTPLFELGDMSEEAPAIEKIIGANKKALSVIKL